MQSRYTVSIYVAAPGTPLANGTTSAAGHLYFEISHGQDRNSFGFAPSAHGSVTGPGEVSNGDVQNYSAPFYRRTMEISKAQYEKLKDFAENPEKHNFDMNYNGATNSCIDFTWGALNHAGLHGRPLPIMELKNFEGNLKPLDNVGPIRSIQAPFPSSKLNKEHYNDMPPRSLKQWLISDADLPPDDRTLLTSIRGHVAELDKQHGRQPDKISECVAASLLCRAEEGGLKAVDHVVLSTETATAPAGHRIFAVEGVLADPCHKRVDMLTTDAMNTPVQESFARVEQMNQDQHAAAQAQMLNQAQVQEQSVALQRMA